MRPVFGGLLLGIGILIGGLSGLCSLFMAADLVLGTGGGSDNFLDWPTLFIVGGIPFAFGLGIAYAGWKLLNPARPVANQSPVQQAEIKPAEPAAPPTLPPE